MPKDESEVIFSERLTRRAKELDGLGVHEFSIAEAGNRALGPLALIAAEQECPLVVTGDSPYARRLCRPASYGSVRIDPDQWEV
jgi:hypothetical protein